MLNDRNRMIIQSEGRGTEWARHPQVMKKQGEAKVRNAVPPQPKL